MCKLKIQKNQGCNHMTCGVCRYEWCWVCNSDFYLPHCSYNGIDRIREPSPNPPRFISIYNVKDLVILFLLAPVYFFCMPMILVLGAQFLFSSF